MRADEAPPPAADLNFSPLVFAPPPSPPAWIRDMLGTYRALDEGAYLFHAGSVCEEVFWIENGCLEVSTICPDGDEQVLRFCFPGDFVGIDAAAAGYYLSSARALDPTRVRPVFAEALHHWCRQSTRAYDALLGLIDAHIEHLQQHLLTLGQKAAPARLAQFLLGIADRTRSRQFTLSMSRHAISSYLGMKPETLSRTLRQFERARFIRRRARHVHLLDVPALKNCAAKGASGGSTF